MDPWNLRLMLKISYASCPDLSFVTLMQFALEMCLAAQNRQKIHKNCDFSVQGHSKVIALGVNQKPMYDFLLVINSNRAAISHLF